MLWRALTLLIGLSAGAAWALPPLFPNFTWSDPGGLIVKANFNQVAAEIVALEGRAAGRGNFSTRPAASTSLTTRLWIVPDCSTSACTTGGGTIACVTRVNDTGSAWDTGPCDGGGGGGMTSFLVNGDAGSAQTITNGNTLTIVGGTGLTCTGGLGGTDFVTCNLDTPVAAGSGGTGLSAAVNHTVLLGNATPVWVAAALPTTAGSTYPYPLNYNAATHAFGVLRDPIRADAQAGVDCTGASDSTSGLNTVLASLTGTNSTLWVPSGCRLGLASPSCVGTVCGPSITIPNNVHLVCEDQSAGIFAVRQRCVGGTYPDAACATSAECLGGGTCSFDFGASTYAPTAANTYTMIADANAQSSDIYIENCSVWTYQSDGYQRCVGGANAGKPCRKECDNNSVTPGARCELTADCTDGTHTTGLCARSADCSGGTCSGTPHTASGASTGTATGKIDPLNLSRTFNSRLVEFNLFDHYVGDFGINLGNQTTLFDVNVARDINDCTQPPAIGSPITATSCFTTNNGQCCNGGAYNTAMTGGAQAFNTQPTTAVTQGIVVGTDSQMVRVFSRGVTAFTGGTRIREDETTVWPQNMVGQVNLGPGTQTTNGWNLGAYSQVAKSFALDLCGNGVGITLNGDSGAVGDKIGLNSTCGASGTGLNMAAGSNNHAMGMNIQGVNGAGIGVNMLTSNSALSDSFVSGNAATGVLVAMAAPDTQVAGSTFQSIPVDTQQTAIKVNGARNVITGNSFRDLLQQSIYLNGLGTSGVVISGNTSRLRPLTSGTSGQTPCTVNSDCPGGTCASSQCSPATITYYSTPSFWPRHIYDNGVFAHGKQVVSNYFEGGSKGYYVDGGRDGLINAAIGTNRFYRIGGQIVTVGSAAGVSEQGNYVNHQAAGWTTSCDQSCDATHRGVPCNQDTDCTGCTSTNKCVPDALWTDIGSQHFSAFTNLWFQGVASQRQCITAGPVGQACDVLAANGSCAASATCSGTPAICQSGADIGKRCCTTAGSGTCDYRQQTPGVRINVLSNDMIIADNQIFNGGAGILFLDLLTSTPGATASISNSKITGNLIHALLGCQNGTGTANSIGSACDIDFATCVAGGGTCGGVNACTGGSQAGKQCCAGTTGNVCVPAANITGIRFPTVPPSHLDVQANTLINIPAGQEMVNVRGTYGAIAYPVRTFALQDDMTTNSTSFVNLAGSTSGIPLQFSLDSARRYKFDCELMYTSSSVTTGVGFALTGPPTPTTFDYITRIPNIAVATAGTDVIAEQEGNGDDATATASPGVASTAIVYTAAIRGNIVTAAVTSGTVAGNLTVRVKTSAANNVTVKAGANCIVTQLP